MVERIIPSDYYSDLAGVLIDLKVFNVLLQQKQSQLCKLLYEECEPAYTIDMLAFQWFLSAFTH